MSHQRLLWLLAVSVLAEQVFWHGSPVTAAAAFPPGSKFGSQTAEGSGNGRILQEAAEERQEMLSGVKAPLTVTLSAEIQWTPNLYRAGRVRIRPEGFVCGAPGSSDMDTAVQPSCVGSICLGPMSNTPGTAFWNGVKISRPGVYTLCWCEPEVSCAGPEAGFSGAGCCLTDSDFSVNKGEILVRGPKWSGSDNPLLGEPFKVDLTGSVASRSSQLLFRFQETEDANGAIVEGGPCGGSLSAEEREASEVLVREDRWSQNHPNSANFTVRLFRRRWYIACWCAGETHEEADLQDCGTDAAFLGELRAMIPRGPLTESVPVSHAVVGVPFALKLDGNVLGSGDRLRIIDGSKACGTDDTYHSPAVSYFVCRGEANCVQSAVSMQPSMIQGSPPAQSETWDPVVLKSPGLFKMCWCVDNTWDSQTLESHGYCSRNAQFAVPVGTLLLEGIDGEQSFYCYAFTPCTIHVSSHLAVNGNDGIFIVSQQDLAMVTCGSGMQGVSLLATGVNESYDADGNQNNTITFIFSPHAGPPGTFRVCYCQSVGMGLCSEPTVFAQRAGILYITRPPDGVEISLQEPPQYCLVGRSCSVSIAGVWASQMHVSDAFRAVPERFECGSAPLSVTSRVFSLAFRIPLPSGGMQASFLHADAWSKSPGDYRLCYCSVMMLEYSEMCDYHEYFRQSTGLLIVYGVAGVHTFLCSQGFACNITVPGWRFAWGDRLLLLAGDAACGASVDDSQLALGFVTNPAGSPNITSAAAGDFAEFAFDLAYGAGDSRVCFCAMNTSANACEDIGEFTQNVGTLKVSGAITSVSLSPSHPAVTSIVSLIINAELLSRVTCAVTEEAMPTIPSLFDVVKCHERFASCLGVERLRWQIRPGPNVIHVPITFNRSLSADTPIPQVHAWCAADWDWCHEGRCAMPPTPVGHVIDLQLGKITFSEWRVVRGESLTFTITANPLNTKGEVGVFNVSEGCGADRSLLDLGRPTEKVQLSSVTWKDKVFTMPGRYLLCWCDRGYSTDCSLWHRAGVIVVAGPAPSWQWLPWVNPSQAFTVDLPGVDYTSSSLMAVVSGNNCTDIGTRLVSTSSPFSSSGDSATWELIAPAMEGNYTLCWGENSSESADQRRLQEQVYHTVVGFFQTIERKDCVLTSWVTGDCDRPCGGGTLIERRGVIAWPTGGGEECPSGTGIVRTKSCNPQTCPTAIVFEARTIPVTIQPGQIFKVVLEGDFLAPYEDRIILIRGEEECGNATQIQGGATCDLPDSTTTNLKCGDGVYSVRVQEPGTYRICVCDASVSPVWQNGTQLLCGSASAFRLTPINGSQFKTIGARVNRDTDGLFTAFEEGGKSSGSRQQGGAPEDKSQDLVVILSLAGGGLMLVVALCSWRCLIKEYMVKKEVKKPQKVIDTRELVEQATREVWNAYARSIVEGVEDQELVAESQAILDENALVAARKSARSEGESIAQPEPEPSDPNSSSAGSASTSRLTTPDDLISRRTTPPLRSTTPPTGRKGTLTPPLTRNTTPGTPKTCRTPTGGSRATSRGGSRACTPPTPKSRASFFQESLPPLGAPKTPPQQGGSFLNMPLLGVSSRPSSSATGPVSQNDINDEAFKRSGSSWNSSCSYPTRSSSASATSSYSSSARSHSESSNADPPMAPRGRPTPFMKLEPLELPPRPPESPSIEPGTPPPLGTQSSEVLELETAPNAFSPLDSSTLSSSTARPPGFEPPKPPPSMPHAPEGPPLPPPEGLLDIINLKTSLMNQLPQMPPPPPPPMATRKIGKAAEDPAPPLSNLPEMPSFPPPLLLVGNAFEEQAESHESSPVRASTLQVSTPTKENVHIVKQSASKGWGLTSMFSGAKLPWSGSSKQPRSAKVSAMPAPAPTSEPIGPLMQEVDLKKNEPSCPKAEPIGARLHEASPSSSALAPPQQEVQGLEAEDKDLVQIQNVRTRTEDEHSDRMRDTGHMPASCLPTQKPEQHHVPTESGCNLRETASAEEDDSKQPTPRDARSEARSFMASLRKTGTRQTKVPTTRTSPSAKKKSVAATANSTDTPPLSEKMAVAATAPPIDTSPPVEENMLNTTLKNESQEAVSKLASNPVASNADVATTDETVTSVPDPVADMDSTGMNPQTNASLAVILETSSSAEATEISRPQSAPYNSSRTTAASSKDIPMSKQSHLQGRYMPGTDSNRASSTRRKRPQSLDDEDDLVSCAGSEYQLRYTGREQSSPNAEGMRAEVFEAQEKIRKEWHDKLAGETDWNQVPHPKATLARPHASTRDKLRPTIASSDRTSRTSATSSQSSSAVSSPQNQTVRGLGMPGPPLPGGFAPGPPLQGKPQLASGSAMPGPPLVGAPKGPGRGPTFGPGPPLNSRGPGRALPAWALK